MKVRKQFIGSFRWSFGTGCKILIGQLDIRDVEVGTTISLKLRSHLNRRCVFYLAQIIEKWVVGVRVWMGPEVLNIPEALKGNGRDI